MVYPHSKLIIASTPDNCNRLIDSSYMHVSKNIFSLLTVAFGIA